MRQAAADWADVAERLLAGDRAALLQVSRLVTSFLARWRAYDHREEWADLVQEVLVAVVTGLRRGTVHDPAALVGFVAAVTRHKLADRVRAARGRGGEDRPAALEGLGWGVEASEPNVERVVELRLLLDKLPEKQRLAVCGVYGEGRTYEAVARESGIPLGTLKRCLRDALATLRRELGQPS